MHGLDKPMQPDTELSFEEESLVRELIETQGEGAARGYLRSRGHSRGEAARLVARCRVADDALMRTLSRMQLEEMGGTENNSLKSTSPSDLMRGPYASSEQYYPDPYRQTSSEESEEFHTSESRRRAWAPLLLLPWLLIAIAYRAWAVVPVMTLALAFDLTTRYGFLKNFERWTLGQKLVYHVFVLFCFVGVEAIAGAYGGLRSVVGGLVFIGLWLVFAALRSRKTSQRGRSRALL